MGKHHHHSGHHHTGHHHHSGSHHHTSSSASTGENLYFQGTGGIMMEERSIEEPMEELLEEEIPEEKEENELLEKAKEDILNILRQKRTAISRKYILKKLGDKYDEETIDDAITELLAQGEIYEPETGYYKLL
uniref:RPA32 subunit of the hetero-oligomeric complex involved in homologous recombination n=2 Tax=Pyrococcus abyssi (strain GE5 / Orsay) TaxID=272844 RepID=UPI00387FB20D